MTPNPNPSPELLQRARMTLADARIAAGSLFGDCPDDVAVSAMLAFAALSPQTLPAPGGVEAYRVSWFEGSEPRKRVQLTSSLEPWLAVLNPVVTPLYATVAAANDEGVALAIEALEAIAASAEVRIQDGRDMGPRIWRIALEDIVTEARDAIRLLSQGGGKA